MSSFKRKVRQIEKSQRFDSPSLQNDNKNETSFDKTSETFLSPTLQEESTGISFPAAHLGNPKTDRLLIRSQHLATKQFLGTITQHQQEVTNSSERTDAVGVDIMRIGPNLGKLKKIRQFEPRISNSFQPIKPTKTKKGTPDNELVMMSRQQFDTTNHPSHLRQQNNELDLSGQGFTGRAISAQLVKSAEAANTTNVTILDISGNKICQIPPQMLQGNHHLAANLRDLNLSNNKVELLPEEMFSDTKSLRILNLASNNLKRVPETLFGLEHLQLLNLSKNKLVHLSPKISLLQKLQKLYLVDNCLETLPNSLGYIETLKELSSEFFWYINKVQIDAGLMANTANQQTSIDSVFSIEQQLQSNDFEEQLIEMATKKAQLMTLCRDQFHQATIFSKLQRLMRISIEQQCSLLDLLLEFISTDANPEEEAKHIVKFVAIHQFETDQSEVESTVNLAINCFQRSQLQQIIGTTRLILGLNTSSGNGSGQTLQQKLGIFHHFVSQNHPNLLKNFIKQTNKLFQNALNTLSQTIESQKQDQQSQIVDKQKVIDKIRTFFGQILVLGLNCENDVGYSSFETALSYVDTECASILVDEVEEGLTITCDPDYQTSIPSRRPSQLDKQLYLEASTRPGNQQSSFDEERGENLRRSIVASQKIHPIVTSIMGGHFDLASKLITLAIQNEQKIRLKHKERKQRSREEKLKLTSEVQPQISLNIADFEIGMTFLHHLFANFDKDRIKATHLFFKLAFIHSKRMGNRNSNEDKFFQMVATNLNVPSKFCETPLDIAVEHHQNSALEFAIKWNSQLLRHRIESTMVKQLSQQKQIQKENSRNIFESLDILTELREGWPVDSIKKESINKCRLISFNGNRHKNERNLSILHRAVITGNFIAIKILLQSPLFLKADELSAQACLSQEKLHAINLDMFKVDIQGKKPRDYAQKVVFLSKLIEKASKIQIYRNVNFKKAKKELKEKKFIPGGLGNNFSLVKHSCLNKVFIRRQRINRLNYSSFWTQRNSKSPNVDQLLLSSTQQPFEEPFEKRAFSSFGSSIQQYSSSAARRKSKGIKKAKSMAFNSMGTHFNSKKLAMHQLVRREETTTTGAGQQNGDATDNNTETAKTNSELLTFSKKDNSQIDIEKRRLSLQVRQNGVYTDDTNQDNKDEDIKILKVNGFKQDTKMLMFRRASHQANNTNNLLQEKLETELIKGETNKEDQREQRVFLTQGKEKNDKSNEKVSKFDPQKKAFQSPLFVRENRVKLDLDQQIQSSKDFSNQNLQTETDNIRQKRTSKLMIGDQQNFEQYDVQRTQFQDFDDSGSAGSYTPLPCIQNEYTLTVKSLNQDRRPYHKQLLGNQFREEFERLMGCECLNPSLCQNRPNSSLVMSFSVCKGGLGNNQSIGTLSQFTKIQLLYKIVREAKTPTALQDAKDVFDFLQFEINHTLTTQKNMLKKSQLDKGLSRQIILSNVLSARNNGIVMLQNEVGYLRQQLNCMNMSQRVVVDSFMDEQNGWEQGLQNEKITESESHVNTPSLQDWKEMSSTPPEQHDDDTKSMSEMQQNRPFDLMTSQKLESQPGNKRSQIYFESPLKLNDRERVKLSGRESIDSSTKKQENLDDTGFPSFEIDENFNNRGTGIGNDAVPFNLDKQDSVPVERKSTTKANELKVSIVSNQISLKKTSRLHGHRLSELLDPSIQFFSQSSVVENQQRRKVTEMNNKVPRGALSKSNTSMMTRSEQEELGENSSCSVAAENIETEEGGNLARSQLHLMESSPNIGSRLGRQSKSIRLVANNVHNNTTHMMNQTNSQISLSVFNNNSVLKKEDFFVDKNQNTTHFIDQMAQQQDVMHVAADQQSLANSSSHRQLRLSSTKQPAWKWKKPSTTNTVRLNLQQPSISNSTSQTSILLAANPTNLPFKGGILRPSESVGSSLTAPLGQSRSDLVASTKQLISLPAQMLASPEQKQENLGIDGHKKVAFDQQKQNGEEKTNGQRITTEGQKQVPQPQQNYYESIQGQTNRISVKKNDLDQQIKIKSPRKKVESTRLNGFLQQGIRYSQKAKTSNKQSESTTPHNVSSSNGKIAHYVLNETKRPSVSKIIQKSSKDKTIRMLSSIISKNKPGSTRIEAKLGSTNQSQDLSSQNHFLSQKLAISTPHKQKLKPSSQNVHQQQLYPQTNTTTFATLAKPSKEKASVSERATIGSFTDAKKKQANIFKTQDNKQASAVGCGPLSLSQQSNRKNHPISEAASMAKENNTLDDQLLSVDRIESKATPKAKNRMQVTNIQHDAAFNKDKEVNQSNNTSTSKNQNLQRSSLTEKDQQRKIMGGGGGNQGRLVAETAIKALKSHFLLKNQPVASEKQSKNQNFSITSSFRGNHQLEVEKKQGKNYDLQKLLEKKILGAAQRQMRDKEAKNQKQDQSHGKLKFQQTFSFEKSVLLSGTTSNFGLKRLQTTLGSLHQNGVNSVNPSPKSHIMQKQQKLHLKTTNSSKRFRSGTGAIMPQQSKLTTKLAFGKQISPAELKSQQGNEGDQSPIPTNFEEDKSSEANKTPVRLSIDKKYPNNGELSPDTPFASLSERKIPEWHANYNKSGIVSNDQTKTIGSSFIPQSSIKLPKKTLQSQLK